MGRYLRIVEGIVQRYGGYIDRLVGDGMLVYFGWPVANEDQVERAAAAGLEIIQDVGGLEVGAGAYLNCRVGIATGDVVVGEIFGAKRRWETVVGSTPNLAARLQSAAPPQAVFVDAATCDGLKASFLLEELPLLTLKGFSDPVHAWRVLESRRHQSRFSARGIAGSADRRPRWRACRPVRGLAARRKRQWTGYAGKRGARNWKIPGARDAG